MVIIYSQITELFLKLSIILFVVKHVKIEETSKDAKTYRYVSVVIDMGDRKV